MLSQRLQEQLQQFMAVQMDAFHETHDHPYIGQQRRCTNRRLAQNNVFQSQFGFQRPFRHLPFLGILPLRDFRRRLILRRLPVVAAMRVKPFLETLARWRPIVGGAALVAALPAMMRSAAERAAQIPPSGAARMCQKADPAVRAEGHAVLQSRLGPQYRVQRDLILPDKRPGAITLVPILAKRENLLDGDDKKARLSVIT